MSTNAVSRPKQKIEVLQAGALKRIAWLVHGFSTRTGGFSTAYGGHTLNLGFTKHDSRPHIEKNRAALLNQLGAVDRKGNPWPLVALRQVHSDIIHRVPCVPEHLLTADGVVTDTPGLLLAVQTADCLPVILVDAKRKAVGVFHAGWRGTVKRIVEKGIGEMRHWFGTMPTDIRAAIGPGIQKCCYEVGDGVQEKFRTQFAYADELFHELKESDAIRERYPLLFLTARAPGHSELPRKLFLDLVEANRRQLLAAGVPARNIVRPGTGRGRGARATANGMPALPLCTACHPELFFSYRAEHGNTGRMMGVVGVRP